MATQDEWTDYTSLQNISRTFKPSIDKKFPNDIIDLPRLNYSFSDNLTESLEYSNFTSEDYCSSNHSHVYLNVTCEFPINYAEPMYG